ncbi:MAG: hypothetical protein KFH87_09260 [Bacteroidetes bacterium]|nr:hypothetical protein [Bacteroidota bacterium]
MKKFRLFSILLPVFLIAACSDDTGVDPPVNGSDTEKPFVEFVSPTNDQQVAGDEMDVIVNATDNHTVVKVEIYLNTQPVPVATMTEPPWTATIDISALPAGLNSISAKAWDSTGNASDRATVSFFRQLPGTFRFIFTSGAEFTYDRWDLLADNVVDESTRRNYYSRFEQGSGDVGGHSVWYRMISTDAMSNRSDTMIAHSNAQYNILVYGLANELVRRFTRPLVEQGFLPTAPELPAPHWSYLVKVNDDNGETMDPGETWDITAAGGISIPFGMINATITMDGTYVDRGSIIIVNGKEIYTWEILINVVIDFLGNQSTVPVHLWFSDDPSGQIMLQQETTMVTIPLVGEFPVPGDQQVLLSWK